MACRRSGSRSYVQLEGKLNYDAWCAGIEAGRTYVSDDYSHLLDFKINNVPVGGADVTLDASGEVEISVDAACLLPEKSASRIRAGAVSQKPFWHPERARIPGTRTVPVEVLLNGESV